MVLRLIQRTAGQHKLSSPWEGPFIVSRVLRNDAYYLIDMQVAKKNHKDGNLSKADYKRIRRKAHKILENALHGLTQSRGGAGLLFVVGLAGAVWAASGYIGGFIRASNTIWDVEEGRPIWKTLPLRIVITIVTLLLLAVTAVAVVVTGPLAHKVGKLVGIGGAAVTAWDIAKWPVLIIVVSLMFSILYYASPNVRQPGFRWVTPGGIFAVVTWIVASAVFGVYVANFGSYNKTYGSLGAIVIFLVWLWLTNLAILFGAELNAEIERGRQIEAGQPEEQEPFLPPRDEPG